MNVSYKCNKRSQQVSTTYLFAKMPWGLWCYRIECFCGNSLNTNTSRDSSDEECNKSCPGDEFETCGANWELMVYRTGLSGQ